MKLFDEMPYLEDDEIVLREMRTEDAGALGELSKDPAVYVYLPTFLFEQKYDSPEEVIKKMRAECFQTKESVLLGVFLKKEPDHLAGIGEIYAYDEQKNKASIGVRLAKAFWNKGIARRVVTLLKDYLDETIRIRTITAHIMKHNIASEKMTEKAGFVKKFPDLWEDWGKEGPVLTDKYIYKNPRHEKHEG